MSLFLPCLRMMSDVLKLKNDRLIVLADPTERDVRDQLGFIRRRAQAVACRIVQKQIAGLTIGTQSVFLMPLTKS